MPESLTSTIDLIHQEFYAQRPPVRAEVSRADAYVVEVFEDHVIVSTESTYYKVGYSKNGEDSVMFADPATWQEVEKQTDWIAKSVRETVLLTGRNPLKSIAISDDEWRVGNYIVLFGDKDNTDLTNEWFTKETNLESEYTKKNMLVVDFEHGEDPDVQGEEWGFVDWATKKVDDIGVWVERVLDRRNTYVNAIAPLIEAQMIGTSSQADPPGIQKTKDGEIKTWPLFRDTLTVMPAEWRMMQDNAIQGALKTLNLVKGSPQKAAMQKGSGEDPATAAKPEGQKKTIVIKETKTMDPKEVILREFASATGLIFEDLNDAQKTLAFRGTEFAEKTIDEKFEAMEAGQKAISDQMAEILKALQDNVPAKSMGYISEVGGKDPAAQKTFGDFLVAVARKDVTRLNKVYGSFKSIGDSKAMNEGAGVGGGYTVPTVFRDTLLKMAAQANDLRSKVTVAPGMAPRGEWPALDQFITVTPGQGDSPHAAGIVARKVAENEAFAETEAVFKQIKWNLEKVGGVTEVSNELINNSSESIDQLLSMLFALAIGQRREYYILRGNGAGEPLGILNSPCLINVDPITNNVWTLDDATTMLAHFRSFLSPGEWMFHNSIIPDLASFEVGTGGAVLLKDVKGDPVLGTPLLGKLTSVSGHLPQANNSGCVILGDFSAYMLFEGKELEVAFSEHAKFEEDKGVWRFKQHLDGQPWLSGAITLPDPQGSYSVSPFVSFND